MQGKKTIISKGDKYGEVILTGESVSINWKLKVQYVCKCGKIGWTDLASLKSGATISCGCFRKERASISATKHGLCKHPLYSVWCGMINRCYNENATDYKYYGGNGVVVCDEWRNFLPFYNWAIENNYRKGLELDKDKLAPNQRGKIYCPEYCSFLTPKENKSYRKGCNTVRYNGEDKILAVWCEQLNLHYEIVKQRIWKLKWSVEDAFETPHIKAKLIEYNNEKRSLQEWCDILGFKHLQIWDRLNRGWDIKKAFETPIRKVTKTG